MDSTARSVKRYADDVTVISNDFDTHVSVLQTIDQHAVDLDLLFKLAKCVFSLPTEVNLHRWKTQCSAQCVLCNSTCATTAHISST